MDLCRQALFSSGTVSSPSPNFPSPGGSTSWTCDGANGGSDASCSASRSENVSGLECRMSPNKDPFEINNGSTEEITFTAIPGSLTGNITYDWLDRNNNFFPEGEDYQGVTNNTLTHTMDTTGGTWVQVRFNQNGEYVGYADCPTARAVVGTEGDPGVCGDASGTTISDWPSGWPSSDDYCSSGTGEDRNEGTNGFSWTCKGTNGSEEECYAPKDTSGGDPSLSCSTTDGQTSYELDSTGEVDVEFLAFISGTTETKTFKWLVDGVVEQGESPDNLFTKTFTSAGTYNVEVEGSAGTTLPETISCPVGTDITITDPDDGGGGGGGNFEDLILDYDIPNSLGTGSGGSATCEVEWEFDSSVTIPFSCKIVTELGNDVETDIISNGSYDVDAGNDYKMICTSDLDNTVKVESQLDTCIDPDTTEF